MWSNSANKFFDALASGTPVMINYQGWQADLLRDSMAGIVVPPDEPRRAAVELHASWGVGSGGGWPRLPLSSSPRRNSDGTFCSIASGTSWKRRLGDDGQAYV
jgi:hypothetical protein